MSYLYFYTQGDEDNNSVNRGSVSSSHQINPKNAELDKLNVLQEVLEMSKSNSGSIKGSIDKVSEALVLVKRGFITMHIIDTNYILLFLLLFCMYRA
jgi:hypothetical protein